MCALTCPSAEPFRALEKPQQSKLPSRRLPPTSTSHAQSVAEPLQQASVCSPSSPSPTQICTQVRPSTSHKDQSRTLACIEIDWIALVHHTSNFFRAHHSATSCGWMRVQEDGCALRIFALLRLPPMHCTHNQLPLCTSGGMRDLGSGSLDSEAWV